LEEWKVKMAGAVRSHNLSIGIVGLPNSGKSTMFNSLTNAAVPAENYPFCTIDKNIGVVEIKDRRLDKLSEHYAAKKKVPAAIRFIDIAGLVKGASKGEGLGNKFLSHIREVDVVLFVLRAFSSEKITHVYDRVSPLEDLKILETELLLKDIETVEKRIANIERLTRGNNKEAKEEYDVLSNLLDHLYKDKFAVSLKLGEDQKKYVYNLSLLTDKQRMYLLNTKAGIEEEQLSDWVKELNDYISEEDTNFVIKGDVMIMGELSEMSSEEGSEYIEMLNETGKEDVIQIDDIIDYSMRRLNLITFYTGNEEECNAWSIQSGASSVEAAGVIHSDLAKGYITADIVNVEKMLDTGGWVASKEKGIIKNVGKDYIMQDGDYIVVYSNN
jgi:hypothetical protein